MPVVTVNGQRISYIDSGGDGPPLSGGTHIVNLTHTPVVNSAIESFVDRSSTRKN
ncbi:hypothetical protein GCM10023094_34990 [Rhodococcus olei]|uniref:Uncharacterized protein n=1 Tax=Rhodococcus olei TaxID=2161675 RepID=A0ABP8PBA6_9NOCA